MSAHEDGHNLVPQKPVLNANAVTDRGLERQQLIAAGRAASGCFCATWIQKAGEHFA